MINVFIGLLMSIIIRIFCGYILFGFNEIADACIILSYLD